MRARVYFSTPSAIPMDLLNELGGPTRIISGVFWSGRISLGIFLPGPPIWQVPGTMAVTGSVAEYVLVVLL